MTLSEIKQLDRETVTPADIADLLGCDPQAIRVTARTKPELLGFPVVVVGHRTKIPRQAFIDFWEGRSGNKEKPI